MGRWPRQDLISLSRRLEPDRLNPQCWLSEGLLEPFPRYLNVLVSFVVSLTGQAKRAISRILDIFYKIVNSGFGLRVVMLTFLVSINVVNMLNVEMIAIQNA
jgi:hypothetical protein